MNNNKYKILFFTTLGILGIVIIFFSIALIIKDDNGGTKQVTILKKQNRSEKNGQKVIGSVEKGIVEQDDSLNIESSKMEVAFEQNTVSDSGNKNNQSQSDYYIDNISSNSDSEVINFLIEKKNEISSKISDGNYKDKIKSTFISLVDFLFYGGTIKNHTFNELTDKTKLEATKIILQIENKIEEKHPGLIDNIEDKYSNIKSRLVDLYTDKVNNICADREDLCKELKEEYNDMKKSLKNVFSASKNKISDFYQNRIKN